MTAPSQEVEKTVLISQGVGWLFYQEQALDLLGCGFLLPDKYLLLLLICSQALQPSTLHHLGCTCWFVSCWK